MVTIPDVLYTWVQPMVWLGQNSRSRIFPVQEHKHYKHTGCDFPSPGSLSFRSPVAAVHDNFRSDSLQPLTPPKSRYAAHAEPLVGPFAAGVGFFVRRCMLMLPRHSAERTSSAEEALEPSDRISRAPRIIFKY